MKITKRVNFRVEVYPSLFLIENDEEKIKQRTKVLLENIERHIDFNTAALTWDTEEICQYCGYSWEEDEKGCPLCCNKAIDEWEKEHKEKRDETKKEKDK